LVTLDPDVFDVFRVSRRHDRRDFLGQRQRRRDAGGFGRETESLRFAMKVAGGLIPFSSLSAVGRQLEDVAIRAMERFITVQQGLHDVFARGEIAPGTNRMTKKSGVCG
jgi:hypothetical protein